MSLRLPMLHFFSRLFLFLIPISVAFAQPFQRQVTPFPISDSSGVFNFPFSGGYNNIKTQFVDINGDGFKDIIYISGDGTSGRLDNAGSVTNFSFTVNTQKLTGAVLKDWFYLVDLDSDGDYDIATGGQESYVRLYRNTGNQSLPSFSLWVDTLRDDLGQPVIVETASNHTFCDIDNDGDKDFFAGSSLGSITYFQNIGTPQNPVFRFVTTSWQNISIVSGGKAEIERRGVKLHGANAIDFGDLDGDGDFDLLWGDFFSSSMYYIENRGTPSTPLMRVVATGFPMNADSIVTSGFNMPRLADIDNDGDLDLFASVLYDPAAPQRLSFYKNYGTRFTPDIHFVTDDFLRTFDAGTESAPVIFDYNKDGKPDLLTGSSRTPNGTLHLLLNTGTLSSYSFYYSTPNLGGIAAELSITPAIADLNGDGLTDICIGTYYGTVFYYKNIGTQTTPHYILEGTLMDSFGSAIDVGLFARPYFHDIDGDGDIDLICGAYNGRVVLYRNIGTRQNYVFARDESYFGTIDAGDFSAPALSYYGNDTLPQLFIGNRDGSVMRYNNFGTRNAPLWNLAEFKFQNISVGSEATPFFYDIDLDGDEDLFLGCNAGGLYFYRNNRIISSVTDPAEKTGTDFTVNCYVNSSKAVVVSSALPIINISIISVTGEEVANVISGKTEEVVSGKLLTRTSAGVYFVVVKTERGTTVKKILLKDR